MHGSDDPDGDIGPGCFVLDVGLKGFRLRNIWVHSDYLRMYDYCNAHYNKVVGINRAALSMVITGQPGIGTPSFRFVSLWLTWHSGKREICVDLLSSMSTPFWGSTGDLVLWWKVPPVCRWWRFFGSRRLLLCRLQPLHVDSCWLGRSSTGCSIKSRYTRH